MRNLTALAVGLTLVSALPGTVGAQTPDARAVRLLADPPSVEVVLGQTTPFRVVAIGADGQELDLPVRVVAPREALTVNEGEVTGLEIGEHRIIATLVTGGGGSAGVPTLEVVARVTWPAIASLRLEPQAGRLYVGTRLEVAAEARHADGSVRPRATVTWESLAPTVAEVDRFGSIRGVAPGRARILARAGSASEGLDVEVHPFPGYVLNLSGGPERLRTGDVARFQAEILDAAGNAVSDMRIEWSLEARPAAAVLASSAPGQLVDGRFVADAPGLYFVRATAAGLSERRAVEVEPRDVVQEVAVLGLGSAARFRTTDFWVFEGRDGRDYALTGSKEADGHAFVWDVTDPSNIVKTDSIQVDARSVNDVKVSPDARYATVTREGASDRRNGVVILDLADPAHPRVASRFTDGLTGGVHNAFPTETHVFALSNGDKYLILDVTDLEAPRVVAEYDHPNSRVHDVWVHDGIAYSAEWESGVVAVDVGNGRWGGSIDNPVFISATPVPTGRTHAVFPYVSESTGRPYVFIGDELMDRRGLAWAGPEPRRGSYQDRYDPETGLGGVPLASQGYVQILDFSDPEHPEMVARYEVPEYGTHNIWVEDDKLFQAYYEGGLRVVDVSGELMGNLYTQGREIAVYKPFDPNGYVANAPMVWSAMPFKGHVFFADTNSGLWAVRLEPRSPPVS